MIAATHKPNDVTTRQRRLWAHAPWGRRRRALAAHLRRAPDDSWSWLWKLRLRISTYLLKRYAGDVPTADQTDAAPSIPTTTATDPDSPPDTTEPFATIALRERTLTAAELERRAKLRREFGEVLDRFTEIGDEVRARAEREAMEMARREAIARKQQQLALETLGVTGGLVLMSLSITQYWLALYLLGQPQVSMIAAIGLPLFIAAAWWVLGLLVIVATLRHKPPRTARRFDDWFRESDEASDTTGEQDDHPSNTTR